MTEATMNRKAVLFLTGAVMGATGVALSSGDFVAAAAAAVTANTYRALNLFRDVFDGVRRDYVEKPDEHALIEGAIDGMLGSLDPYSSYLSPKDLTTAQSGTADQLSSPGLELTMEHGVIKVVSPFDDSPASRAGILPNDFIIKIDGDTTEGMTLDQAVENLRGAVHSPVTLTVMRKDSEKPFDATLLREQLVGQPVKSREDGQVGYIRISQFDQRTAESLKAAIDKIQSDIGKDKVQGYVLDLRNDPGGNLLDPAIAVSDDFLQGGEIVSIRGRQVEQVQRFKAAGDDLAAGKPIIVLVNGGSASAAEIVAGALQDHRRATIVGTRSFGKGTLQTMIPIGTNGALRLTTGRYYTPAGRSIQTDGIAPDILVTENLPPELAKDFKAPLPGDKTAGKDQSQALAYIPPDPKDDAQLNYALDLLRGTQVNAAFPPDQSKAVPN
jgi:carboxyl-terminal processing protease